MIIAPSQGFAFVHIHKTAGESVSAALVPALTSDDLLIDDGPRNALRRRLLPHYRAARHLSKHSTANEMRAYVGAAAWGALFSFAVVREPLKRAVSLYRYLHTVRDLAASSRVRRTWYRTPLGRQSDPSTWQGIRAINETTTFSEFIRHPGALADPGFRPQIEMINDTTGNRIVTRVIRMENLDDEFVKVQSDIGLAPIRSLPHENTSRPRGDAAQVKVSEQDRDLLMEHFAVDYEEFGYERP